MLANSNDMITNYQILTERFINDNNMATETMRGCVELWLPNDRFCLIMVALLIASSYLKG